MLWDQHSAVPNESDFLDIIIFQGSTKDINCLTT